MHGKKIIIFLLEVIFLLFLGIILIIVFTGGFTYVIGPLMVKAHNLKNPVIVLISILLLRTFLTRSLFRNILLLALLWRGLTSIVKSSDRFVQRMIESQTLRKRVVIGLLVIFLMTVLIAVSNPLQRGLTGRYYDNIEWTGMPLMTTIDQVFDLHKMAYEFPARMTNYSIQWTGVLAIPTPGMYQFTTISDDGSEIVIDGQLVVDNRGFHAPLERTGMMQLEKGFHPITIRYMQGGVFADLEVSWKRPGEENTTLLSSAPLFVNAPSDLSNFWIYRIYQIRNIIFPLLIVFWSVLTSMFIIGVTVQISRKFPFWKMESQGIAGCLIFLIVYCLMYFLLDVPFDAYAFLRYFLCFLIMGSGIFVFMGIVLSVCQNLYKTERDKHAERDWQTSTNRLRSRISTKGPKYSNYLVVLFFFSYFLLGAGIFDDYGISFDEKISRHCGMISLQYLLEGDRQLFQNHEKYHGPAFEIVLVLLEKGIHVDDSRTLYLMRHFVTFLLFFISVIFFYFLCKERFRDWRIGLLGSMFLILSPRIFAHSFYNSKDLPFLSICIISMYTLMKYLDQKTWFKAAIHALLCGFLIGIRVLGVLVPCFTFLLIFLDILFDAKTKRDLKQTMFTLLLYTILVIAFTILFFPILWEAPVHHFIRAFKEMRWYPWGGGVLYLGNYIMATDLPWHYILVWIMITTPLIYTFHFTVGIFVSVRSFLRKPRHSYFDLRKNHDLVYLLWFFVPVFMIIVLKSVVYDAWRHLFFIYPAFLIIALQGFVSLFQGIRSQVSGRQPWAKIVNGVYMLIILLGLCGPIYFMIRYHPYQNVYFNQLAGRNMASVKKDFDLDYWGLSYRQAFEYILQHDSREKIRICVPYFSVKHIAEIFSVNERERLFPAEWLEDADYFASNYRAHKEEYPYENEIYSIKIGGAKIMVVYKLHNFSVDRVE
jgi:hypothetical protein